MPSYELKNHETANKFQYSRVKIAKGREKIITLLSENCELSAAALAKEIGISAIPCVLWRWTRQRKRGLSVPLMI